MFRFLLFDHLVILSPCHLVFCLWCAGPALGNDPESAAADPRQIPLRGHVGAVWSMAYSPDGKTLATGGNDQTVRLWDVVRKRALLALRTQTGAVNAVAFAPD